MRYVYLVIAALAAVGWCQAAPVATYSPDKAAGLTLVTADDGKWDKADVDGRSAVHLRAGTTPRSSYLYFQFDPSVRSKVGSDIYLVVDFYSNGLSTATVEYNSSTSAYTAGPAIVTTPGPAWERSMLHIDSAEFKAAQNGGADFRISGSESLAISGIQVYTEKPDISVPSDRERLQKYLDQNPRRTDMYYTYGNDASEAQAMLFKSLGVTSIESYVTWETCERIAEGKWDWSQWDKQVAILKENGLKWVPFLILSPAYSTPNWFRASKEHVPCGCLEHGINSKIESVWNPNLPKWIDRFIKAFADRYGDSGVIESVLLGIQGDFGEAIYSVSGGGWTFNVPGEYHNHSGYWCNDPYALANFRKAMTGKYGKVEALNKAWGTDFVSLDDVDFPGRGDSLQAFKAQLRTNKPTVRRRWIDFIDWYRASMTQWSDWWMETTRKHFPTTPIYLCTGGDANPEQGSNFAEQCRVAAKHKAGVRITNEASNYPSNFMVTRWVASAGKHYGAYFGFEPAGAEDAKGIVARIYNATASGANQLHDYNPNVVNSNETMEVQKKHFQYLFHVPSPVVPVALWYPNVALTVRWGGFLETSAELRDYVDHDYVDESMLHSGALDKHKILLITNGSIMEPGDAKRIAEWMKKGGRIIVKDVPRFESVEGTSEPETILFGNTPQGRKLGKGSIVRVQKWDGLSSMLSKTMDELGLAHADIAKDGTFATQINAKEFLFYNMNDTETRVNLHTGSDTRPTTLPGGTITRVKL